MTKRNEPERKPARIPEPVHGWKCGYCKAMVGHDRARCPYCGSDKPQKEDEA